MEKLCFKPHEVGEALGVSRSKAYELIRSGEIPSLKVGGSIRVSVDALRDWVSAGAADYVRQVRG